MCAFDLKKRASHASQQSAIQLKKDSSEAQLQDHCQTGQWVTIAIRCFQH
jgi:hypothetical protein